MGDDTGLIFAQSLKNMPFLQSLNLSDNCLTDISLNNMIESLGALPVLTYLNLSCNIINHHAATALATFIAKNRTLTTLILSQADIDDYECELFVAATAENMTLKELNISNNHIGKSELSPVLRKKNGNGADAFASMIGSPDCSLENLNMRWNQIRHQGACNLAQSLDCNKSLIVLDLGYNCLGNESAEIIGSVLMNNKTIASLNLENCNIQGQGCFTLCTGIKENHSLTYVCLDNNPISEFGAVLLMQVPIEVGNRVKISAQNCNIMKIATSCSKFNHFEMDTDYELQLHDPFQRAIALRLLWLVATNPKYIFTKFQHHRCIPRKGRKVEIDDIHLIKKVSTEKMKHLNDKNRNVLKNLNSILTAAGDIEKARSLFEKYDVDGNNSLDAYEMQKLLEDINIKCDIVSVQDAIKAYDIDGAGTIELGEFCLYLNAQAEEARALIKELTETNIFVEREHPTSKYIPPAHGKLVISVARNYANIESPPLFTSSALQSCLDMVSVGYLGSRNKLLGFSIMNTSLLKNEAVQLFHIMKEEISDPAEVLVKILPRMTVSKEASDVMTRCLPDLNDQHRLRNAMGCCLNPLLVSGIRLMVNVVFM